MLNQKNSRKQGDVGLGVAIGYFAALGHTVCVPLTDNQDYDLIVDMGGKVNRVQVKTSRLLSRNSKGYDITLKVCGGNRSGTGVVKKFDPEKVELLFILTDDGSRYVIPSELVKAKTSISVGNTKYEQYKV